VNAEVSQSIALLISVAPCSDGEANSKALWRGGILIFHKLAKSIMAYLMQNQIRTLSGSSVMTHILDVKLTFNMGKVALNTFKLIFHTFFNN
jgi:hypothetical protein